MTQASPFFSAVITLYNKEPYIERAMRSVLAQSDGDFELLVIDDGSTDRGRERAEGVSDARIRVISQANAGEGAARNRGIREARGAHVCFLDGDDEWKPSFLAAIRHLIAAFPQAGLYATGYEVVEAGGACRSAAIALPKDFSLGILPDYFAACVAGAPPVTSSSVCVPRAVFEKVGLFAEGVVRGCDLDFWGRVAFGHPIAFSKQICARYRRDAEGRACNTLRFEKPWVFFETARHLLRTHPTFPSRRQLEDYLTSRAREDALECISLGGGSVAREILRNMDRPRDRALRLALGALSFAPTSLFSALRAMRRGFRSHAEVS